jgi:hypothetical protein
LAIHDNKSALLGLATDGFFTQTHCLWNNDVSDL